VLLFVQGAAADALEVGVDAGDLVLGRPAETK